MTAHDRTIWNAAIDAAIAKLRSDFIAPEVVIAIIATLKKKGRGNE